MLDGEHGQWFWKQYRESINAMFEREREMVRCRGMTDVNQQDLLAKVFVFVHRRLEANHVT